MRKVTFGGAVSLDGFIAREDGGVDWLMWSDEAARLTGDYFARVDAILMGRKTWEFAAANAPGGNVGGMYGGIKTYVFSRTLSRGEVEGAELVAGDAVGFVRDLKRREGREICLMGGGELAGPLFEAGVIDEIGLNIHPVMLGSGVPFFRRLPREIGLELLRTERLSNGCVYVEYRMAGAAG